MQSLNVYINRLSNSVDYLVVFSQLRLSIEFSATDGQRPQEAVRPKELFYKASLSGSIGP